MKFELVTPEKLVVACEAAYINAPGIEGDFGVMDGHMPFVSPLRDGGVLEVRDTEGKETTYTLKGGFAEVTATSVTVLAEGLSV